MTAIRQAVMNLAFLAIVAIAAIMLVPAALGYHRYVILTGSMTGTYDRGSVIFDKPVPTSTLKAGDPITYSPPPGFSSLDLVTHRIVKVTDRKGMRVYKTKGDANNEPDAWEFMLPQPTQDRVMFHVPKIGYLFALLSMRQYRVFLIGIPAVVAALAVVMGMWREAGRLAGDEREGLPDWGTIDHDAMPVHGRLGPLPDAAPVFVGLPSTATAVDFAWARGA
ncbi:MAG: signal peptidase I [Solirubrobacterales bacterium]|nr:signal peptidase I [Solirubrobacterales bacterium]